MQDKAYKNKLRCARLWSLGIRRWKE